MDPNQQPAQPTPPVPNEFNPPQPAPAPYVPSVYQQPAPPVSQPQPEYQPQTQPYISPEPVVVVEPVIVAAQPSVSSFGTSPVFGSAPEATQPLEAIGSQPGGTYTPRKPKTKLFIIIAAIVAGLAVLGVVGWFAYSYIMTHTLPLKTYEGKGYSLLVPESYTVKETGTTIDFTKPNVKSSEESKLEVTSIGSVDATNRATYIAAVDKAFTAEKFTTSLSTSSQTASDVTVTKGIQNGQDIRKVTATAMKDGKKVGTYYAIIYIGKSKMYTIDIAAHVSDPALSTNADKILSSFIEK